MDSNREDSEYWFKQELQQCLDEVKYDGSCWTSHSFDKYVNPGLYIKGYGIVGLPLASRDALAIARLCKQSPFGKGDQTVVDTSIRKTWEPDATEFECKNPAWINYHHSLVAQAMLDLGVQANTRAELYKLLLYEEGAFFKPHKDSEKVPGMFGTLVVCLPSEHTGGEARLVHNSNTKTFHTGPTSAFDLLTMAWYSDVSHEVQPVTSGYRLVLTYNLIQDLKQPSQTAAALDKSHARLERLLMTWKSQYSFREKYIYPLEHQYTKAGRSLPSLKGADKAKGLHLQNLCAKCDLYWFLGRMTKMSMDEEYYDEEEDILTLDYLVMPDGAEFHLGRLPVEEDEVLADIEELYERDADSEDEGESLETILCLRPIGTTTHGWGR